jgi:hypothetical protein
MKRMDRMNREEDWPCAEEGNRIRVSASLDPENVA